MSLIAGIDVGGTFTDVVVYDTETGSTRTAKVLHVIPNHVCSTVNLHDTVYMVEGNDAVEELRVSARGKVR